MSEKAELVLETSDDRFERDVIERSREVPVVVDFWAEWCAPCRMLAPMLESLAAEYAGKFILVKANTELLPRTATQFRIQSIPAVFGFRDGDVQDYFVGVLPEDQLKEWIDKLLPTEAERITAEGVHLAKTDAATAEQRFREALRLDPNLATAKIELASLMFAAERLDECRKLIDELEERGFLEAEAKRIRAELNLDSQARSIGTVDECRAAVAAQPGKPELELQLAEALAAAGQYEEALETSLELVRKHKAQFGEPARQIMVDIFEVLPGDSELVSTYRRRLATALY